MTWTPPVSRSELDNLMDTLDSCLEMLARHFDAIEVLRQQVADIQRLLGLDR